jgi:hypothetical protein
MARQTKVANNGNLFRWNRTRQGQRYIELDLISRSLMRVFTICEQIHILNSEKLFLRKKGLQ